MAYDMIYAIWHDILYDERWCDLRYDINDIQSLAFEQAVGQQKASIYDSLLQKPNYFFVNVSAP